MRYQVTETEPLYNTFIPRHVPKGLTLMVANLMCHSSGPNHFAPRNKRKFNSNPFSSFLFLEIFLFVKRRIFFGENLVQLGFFRGLSRKEEL
jgi:hypothetical protein